MRNVENNRAWQRRAYAKNPEKYRAIQRANMVAAPEVFVARTVAWQKANPEKTNAKAARYRKANPAKVNAKTARERAGKLRATPIWANQFAINETYALARMRSALCGGKWHVDHVVPLRSEIVCGLHVENNLQVIPAIANAKKGNRHLPDMTVEV